MCQNDKCCKKYKKYKCCKKEYECEYKCEYKCQKKCYDSCDYKPNNNYVYKCDYSNNNCKCCYYVNSWFSGYPFRKKTYQYTGDY